MARRGKGAANPNDEWAKYQFGAFISYAHADIKVAKLLERELK